MTGIMLEANRKKTSLTEAPQIIPERLLCSLSAKLDNHRGEEEERSERQQDQCQGGREGVG